VGQSSRCSNQSCRCSPGECRGGELSFTRATKYGGPFCCEICYRRAVVAAKASAYATRPPEQIDPTVRKHCGACKTDKPLTEFYRHRTGAFTSACKDCRRKQSSSHYHANPEQHRAWRRANARRLFLLRRDNEMKKKYGISLMLYDEMTMTQCGTCAICAELPAGGRSERLYVHHCHKTGRFVALICGRCNTGLGTFNDDPILLRRAADVHEGIA